MIPLPVWVTDFFFFHKAPIPALGTNHLVNGCRITIPTAIKRSGREADYSLPLTTEVKNEWRFTSIPPFVFHVVYSNDFTFHRLNTFEDKELNVFENKRQEV